MSPLNPLNQAAGAVPVPEDQREIDASLQAGAVSLRIFPYLVWRYGERGRKFTQSDSAWLAWLTRHDVELVYQQITWLRSVLSNRGMPSSILDTHLTVLNRQLTRSVPENEHKYLSLTTSATRLRLAREAKMSCERVERLATEFVRTVRHGPSFLLTGAARLILAAVADEKLGVKNAVGSLEVWFSDLSGLRQQTGFCEMLSNDDQRLLDSDSCQQLWQAAVASLIANARRE